MRHNKIKAKIIKSASYNFEYEISLYIALDLFRLSFRDKTTEQKKEIIG